MSDFLHNIAAKSLDRTQVVRPKGFSLYESVRTGGRMPGRNSGMAGPDGQNPNISSETPGAQPETGAPLSVFDADFPARSAIKPMLKKAADMPGQRSHIPSNDTGPGDHENTGTEYAISSNPAEWATATSPSSLPGKDQRFLEKTISELRQRTESEDEADPSRERRPRKSIRTTVTRRGDEARNIFPAQARNSPLEKEADMSVGDGNAHRRNAAKVEEPEYQSLDWNMPYNAARPAILKEPAPLGERQESPAAITVTIGRIEVRAISQGTTLSRWQQHAGKRMSLDEYLRRRGGS